MTNNQSKRAIVTAAINMQLADSIEGMLNEMKPKSKKHSQLIAKMQINLIAIRNAEYLLIYPEMKAGHD